MCPGLHGMRGRVLVGGRRPTADVAQVHPLLRGLRGHLRHRGTDPVPPHRVRRQHRPTWREDPLRTAARCTTTSAASETPAVSGRSLRSPIASILLPDLPRRPGSGRSDSPLTRKSPRDSADTTVRIRPCGNCIRRQVRGAGRRPERLCEAQIDTVLNILGHHADAVAHRPPPSMAVHGATPSTRRNEDPSR